MRIERLTLVVLLCAATSGAARAQAAPADSAHGEWLRGMSVGVPGYRNRAAPEFMTIGANLTYVLPGRLGADVALGVLPRGLTAGVLPLVIRVGGARPIAAAPNFLLIPGAGVSLVGAMGSGGIGGIPGLNWGASAIVHGDAPIALRTSITMHRFLGSRGSIWLVELGLVRAPKR